MAKPWQYGYSHFIDPGSRVELLYVVVNYTLGSDSHIPLGRDKWEGPEPEAPGPPLA